VTTISTLLCTVDETTFKQNVDSSYCSDAHHGESLHEELFRSATRVTALFYAHTSAEASPQLSGTVPTDLWDSDLNSPGMYSVV